MSAQLRSADRWWTRAACLGADLDVFFPEHNDDVEAARPAIAICGTCPVIDACLADALATGDWYGVRGGLTGDQRRQLIAAASRTARRGVCTELPRRTRDRS